MTQKDTETYSIQVSKSIRRKMWEHELGDDFDQKIQNGDAEDEIALSWGDTNRSKKEAIENGKQGFLAEACFAHLLDQADVDYNWKGGAKQADFVINGKTIDVKSRASKCEYRNLIKDDKISISDTVDFFVHTVVHYHPLTEKIESVEFLGYISNDEVEDVGSEVQMYSGSESEKKEVHPQNLKSIKKMFEIIRWL